MLFDEPEFRRLKQAARAEGLTMSEWVRQKLRLALRARPTVSVDRKLEAVRAAVRHRFPSADIDVMLAEIERGYGGAAYPAPPDASDVHNGTVHESDA